jgi:hypothetical protein
MGVSSYDFTHSWELIERAAEATEAWLKLGGLRNRDGPAALQRHHH